MKSKQINLMVAERLREQRKRARFRQEDIASELGISRTSYVNIENGNQTLGIYHLHRLCEIMNCEPNDIMPPVNQEKLSPEMEAAIALLPEEKRARARHQFRSLIEGTEIENWVED